MMLTSKQRAQLRGLAATEDTILQVGKGGVSPTVTASARNALAARELVKGRVLENCLLSPREAAEELAEACHAEVVQVIGSKFVLYKRREANPGIQLAGGKQRKPAPPRQVGPAHAPKHGKPLPRQVGPSPAGRPPRAQGKPSGQAGGGRTQGPGPKKRGHRA